MSNKLIRKDDISFFLKIKYFLKMNLIEKLNIHKKDKELNNIKIDENKYNKELEFTERIKINVSEVNKKETKFKNFIKEIEDNPDIIEKLPMGIIDRLIIYYEKINVQKEEKIKKLREKL